ncbi:MAG TPA: SPFH domain-containing protein [Pseudogracilibacillus sp.]|nr:SPFH domain-containing protein [Pseudogracilibacillus sp.]
MRTERDAWAGNGLFSIILIILLIYLVLLNIVEVQLSFVFLFSLLIITIASSLTIVKPNEAKIILLFGKYLGTIRQEGLKYTIPFTKKKRMSLKVNTFESKFSIELPTKTILIHLILFYKVVDTAKVLFEVEDVEQFVQLQSETILKLILLNYEQTFKKDASVVSDELKEQFLALLQEKLTRLGIEITEVYIVS